MANGAIDPRMGEADDGTGEVLDVVLGGAGERARAWLEPLRRSRRLRLVGLVTRSEVPVPDLPCYAEVGEALAAHPTAAFALALPPRAALAGALALARAAARGVVAAPLHESACAIELPAAASRVRVAHGWTTLPGRKAVDKLLARGGAGRIAIEVAGLPDAETGDAGDALVHALALVRSLLPGVSVTAARRVGGELAVELAAGGAWQVALRLRPRGRRLAVRADAGGETLQWSWENGRETVALGGRPVLRDRAAPDAARRALAQLLDAPAGDDLRAAVEVLALAGRAAALLPSGLPVGGRMLCRSASIAERRPDDLLGRLGLRGDPARAGGAVPAGLLELALSPEPFELWAFRAGIKPVAFLTVAPADVERTVGYFGDAHCERRDRLVSVGVQDRWTDRRDEGEPRVELFISRDAALARRAAHLQAEVDPSEAIRELGELVGYPSCCVEAFAAQDDRSNNSLNRYQSWGRTLAAGAAAPWPWQLNNLHAVVAPFYPCTYLCERALAWACAALAEMGKVHPDAVARLAEVLARPVLYFDHDHQMVLDGASDGERVVYRAVSLPHPAAEAFARLAGSIGAGEALRLGDDALVVERAGHEILRLDRTDPGLGFVAPFGRS
jgi:hypothetical protein